MTILLLLCSQQRMQKKYDRAQMFNIQTLQFPKATVVYQNKFPLLCKSVHQFRSRKVPHTVAIGQKGHHEAPPLIPFSLGVGVHVITGRSSSGGQLRADQYLSKGGCQAIQSNGRIFPHQLDKQPTDVQKQYPIYALQLHANQLPTSVVVICVHNALPFTYGNHWFWKRF